MSLEFLEILETRIRETADRLEELASENARLKKEVETLEREKSASAKSARSADAADKIEKAWAKERDEIRKRTETLVERLSALLEAAPRES
jgi:FtsZ-binding cell division protein ZapB